MVFEESAVADAPDSLVREFVAVQLTLAAPLAAVSGTMHWNLDSKYQEHITTNNKSGEGSWWHLNLGWSLWVRNSIITSI